MRTPRNGTGGGSYANDHRNAQNNARLCWIYDRARPTIPIVFLYAVRNIPRGGEICVNQTHHCVSAAMTLFWLTVQPTGGDTSVGKNTNHGAPQDRDRMKRVRSTAVALRRSGIQWTKLPTVVVEHHHHALVPIIDGLRTKNVPSTGLRLVHFDSHPDMQVPQHPAPRRSRSEPKAACPATMMPFVFYFRDSEGMGGVSLMKVI